MPRKNKKHSRRQRQRTRKHQQRQNQRGGWAPYSTGDSMILDPRSLVQSESASYMKAFSDLPSVIPKQMGGSHDLQDYNSAFGMSGMSGTRSQRGGLQNYKDPYVLNGGRRSRGQRQRQKQKQKQRQRGGMAPMDLAFDVPRPSVQTGMNPQFQTESDMGYGFNQYSGAQARA